MRIKIINSTGVEWYSKHIDETFEVEAIPRRGFKNIIVKFDEKRYGYVNKKHCIPIYEIEDDKCTLCKETINFEQNEYEPTLEHGICKCRISYTREKIKNKYKKMMEG